MCPHASRQSTGKMTNRPHVAHLQGPLALREEAVKVTQNGGNNSKVCILGALYRQVVLQGAFIKIGDFIKFKGFLVEFLENRRS